MAEWTFEMEARLREMWGAGVGATTIATALGVSKNAVIGKRNRMGLSARPSPISHSTEPARIGGFPRVGRPSQRREAAGRSTLEVLGVVPASLVGPGLPVVAEMPPPVAKLVPVRWSGRECCWPIGEPRTPGFRYCDGPAVPGRSYCAEHHAESVQKVPAKTFLVPGGVRV
jgi:GcrA cell cycle regulator